MDYVTRQFIVLTKKLHKMAAVEKLNSFSASAAGTPAGVQKRRRSATLKSVSSTGTN
jgi:hypothetical protein